MMRKKILLEIPMWKAKTTNTEKKYIAEANVLLHKGVKYLVVDFFYHSQDARYRLFINENNEYITYDCFYDKWLTSSIGHMYDTCLYNYSMTEYGTDKVYRFIKKYCPEFKNNTRDNHNISRYQEYLLSVKYNDKCKRETAPVFEYMDREVQELPADWEAWVDEHAMAHSRYIIYEYSNKKVMKGYCTHCKSDIEVSGAKHNKEGICPKCGCKVIYKSSGKVKTLDDRGIAIYLQHTTDGGLMLRGFNVYKDYKSDYKNPRIGIYEEKRAVYDAKLRHVKTYYHQMYKQWKTCWCEVGYASSMMQGTVYSSNLSVLQDFDKLKYSAIDILASNSDEPFDIGTYIYQIKNSGCRYSGAPCTMVEYISAIERIIKVGLYKMAADIITGSYGQLKYREPSPARILQLEHDDIKLFIEADAGIFGLDIFKILRKRGYRMNAEQLRLMSKYYTSSYTQGVYKRLFAMEVRPGKLIKYLGELDHNKVSDYRDYLEGCKALGYDLKNEFVAFPKDLTKSHDDLVKAMEILKAKEEAEKHKEIARMEKRLNKIYGFENSKYLIRAPHDAGEIVREGQELHHCVGQMGYIERMAKGNTIILFLRKKEEPDKPYYTIETFDGVVRQVHGFGNKDTDYKDIAAFVNKFKTMISKLKKEKELVS